MAIPTGPSSFLATSPFGQALVSNPAKPFQAFNQKFVKAAAQAGRLSATRATSTSRNVFTSRLSGRPIAPVRKGRPTTSGHFSQFINWAYVNQRDAIEFDLTYLDSAAPYWAIQEIGTGHSARLLDSVAGPGVVSVPSQRGRQISSNLVWAAGPGAHPSVPARGSGNEQLFLRSQVLASGFRKKRMRINREIKAKHYLRDGAKSGFRLYRQEMTKAFRQSYR